MRGCDYIADSNGYAVYLDNCEPCPLGSVSFARTSRTVAVASVAFTTSLATMGAELSSDPVIVITRVAVDVAPALSVIV